MQIVVTSAEVNLLIQRLAHQLTENITDFSAVVFVGVQPRGIYVSEKIIEAIKALYPAEQIQYGVLDITFYRDDVRSEIHVPSETKMPISIEGKKVILIDDVLYTGRTIRAALDALQDFGRASAIELSVLINRKFERQIPIQPNYIGKNIDSQPNQKIKFLNNEVCMYE
jgi:pyrimidine operon attenuation protein / uracil phosphoribosyltransferase